jgi:hypothetical protein
MKRSTALAKLQEPDPLEAELAELGEECARVLLLLQRLARARAEGRSCAAVLGELSATVLHIHTHTTGLDELIDNIESD